MKGIGNSHEGTLVGIRNFNHIPAVNWVSGVLLTTSNGDIRAKYNADNVNVFPACDFDIIGVLLRDIEGFYIQIRSNDDFRPAGSVNVIENLPPFTTLLIGNYPNPFNPST